MLKSIQVTNVRAFDKKSPKLELSPVTALCGTNSAGKSTLIKCLLLLKANIAFDTELDSKIGRIQFSSSDFDLGDFRSFVTNNDVRKKISITIESEGSLNSSAFTLNTLRKVLPKSKHKRLSEKQDKIPFSLSASFCFKSVAAQQKSRKHISEQNAEFGILDQSILKLFVFNHCITTFQTSLTPQARASFPVAMQEDDEMPYECRISRRFFEASGGTRILRSLTESPQGDDLEFVPLLNGILPSALFGLPAEPKSKSAAEIKSKSTPSNILNEPKYVTRTLPPILRQAIYDFRQDLKGLDYTAPLRAHAKRFYILNEENSGGNDSTGESIPYLLRDNLEAETSIGLPSDFSRPIRVSLKKALNSWLHYFRTGEVEDSGDKEIGIDLYRGLIGEIRLKGSAKYDFPLVDIGFGFSQILPILVKGLLLKEEGTMVVEQPELHLHPALQIRLAEFLLSISFAGKNVIFETHSEHIINAIRTLAAEDLTDALAKNVRIFFLSTENRTLKITDLSVQKDGTLLDLPKDFFGEALALSGRLLRAQRAKRTAVKPV